MVAQLVSCHQTGAIILGRITSDKITLPPILTTVVVAAERKKSKVLFYILVVEWFESAVCL